MKDFKPIKLPKEGSVTVTWLIPIDNDNIIRKVKYGIKAE